MRLAAALWTRSGVFQVLRHAVEDMNGRVERVARLPDDICAEGKVFPWSPRCASYGMPRTVILMDEVHRYVEQPTTERRSTGC